MNRCSFSVLICLLVSFVLGGCFSDQSSSRKKPAPEPLNPTTLTVFAAASLTEAFTEIAQAFEREHPGVEVTLNLAGSHQLAQQLSFGAPGDVYASADLRQMQAAVDAGRIRSDSPTSFAGNRLVVVAPSNNPARISQLRDLAKPDLRLVLAAEAVPAGRYTRIFLDKASRDDEFNPTYMQDVLANTVSFEQNVRAVFTKIALDEADAGIVYASDLNGAQRDRVISVNIPENLNAEVTYTVAPVIDTEQPDLVRAFIDFVISADGLAILKQFGFCTR